MPPYREPAAPRYLLTYKEYRRFDHAKRVACHLAEIYGDEIDGPHDSLQGEVAARLVVWRMSEIDQADLPGYLARYEAAKGDGMKWTDLRCDLRRIVNCDPLPESYVVAESTMVTLEQISDLVNSLKFRPEPKTVASSGTGSLEGEDG